MTDLISRADALEQMAQAACGLHYDDCEADNCSCSYIQRILDIPSAKHITEKPNDAIKLSNDLINRADAIEAVKKEIQDFDANYMHGDDDEEYGHDIGFVVGLHRAKALIKELPSADVVSAYDFELLKQEGKVWHDKYITLKEQIEPSGDLISRADAIDAIDDAIDADSPQWAILRTKIGFLPSAELPKGELISRADAIERIVNDNVVGGMDRVNEYRNSNELNDYLDGISCAIATVDDVPSSETHEIRTETHGVCLISKADAMGAVQDHFNDDGFKGYDDGQKMMDRINALPSAEAVPQSEQYKKGFEDAKRAFELEFAREAESIRKRNAQLEVMLNAQKAISAETEWIPLSYDDYGLVTDFPYERDGEWVIVTDGKTISVERIKKDAYDHFFPNGRWFGLEDVIAWMPLPKPYREESEVEE